MEGGLVPSPREMWRILINIRRIDRGLLGCLSPKLAVRLGLSFTDWMLFVECPHVVGVTSNELLFHTILPPPLLTLCVGGECTCCSLEDTFVVHTPWCVDRVRVLLDGVHNR